MELVIDNVGKLYKGKGWGLRNFSLTLRPGVLGLLGPNGAGKSTLMRILATITKPTEGTVTWNGDDIVTKPDAIRGVLGYLPQDFGVYPNLNAVEFLQYTRQILAAWGAGVVLALVMASGVAVRCVASGDFAALGAIVAGAVFVPAMALAAGAWTGGRRCSRRCTLRSGTSDR